MGVCCIVFDIDGMFFIIKAAEIKKRYIARFEQQVTQAQDVWAPIKKSLREVTSQVYSIIMYLFVCLFVLLISLALSHLSKIRLNPCIPELIWQIYLYYYL